MARWQAYRSVDLVVHTHGDNERGRWVTEIVAPSVEDDGGRFVMHRLMGAQSGAPDGRARVLNEPQRPMLERLVEADPSFSTVWWQRRPETHRPLRAVHLQAAPQPGSKPGSSAGSSVGSSAGSRAAPRVAS